MVRRHWFAAGEVMVAVYATDADPSAPSSGALTGTNQCGSGSPRANEQGR
jgi:hypothetical protein